MYKALIIVHVVTLAVIIIRSRVKLHYFRVVLSHAVYELVKASSYQVTKRVFTDMSRVRNESLVSSNQIPPLSSEMHSKEHVSTTKSHLTGRIFV